MHRTLLFILILFGTSIHAQTPFEGVITYKVTTRLKDQNNPHKEYYLKKYGDSLKIDISKEGSQKYQYFGNSDRGFQWHVYDQLSNKFHAKWKGIDTVYSFDCGKIVSDLKSIQADKTTTILGIKCSSVKVVTFDPFGKETLGITYYYSGKEAIAPHAYANYKEGYLDRMYDIAQSHILKFEKDLMHVFVTIEAIRIEPKKIAEKEFSVPASLPLIKWF